MQWLSGMAVLSGEPETDLSNLPEWSTPITWGMLLPGVAYLRKKEP